MKLFSANYHAALAAAMMLAAASRSHYAVAFAPVQTNNRYVTKGRETRVLQSTVVLEAAAPEAKSITKKSPTEKKQKSVPMKKGKKQKQKSTKKNSNGRPKGKKGKGEIKKNSKKRGKTSPGDRSFKPLKDLKLGSTISGNIVDVCDFGVFVNIGHASRGSRTGAALLHISQIQDKKVSNIRDVYKVGDVIEGARVITIDLKKGEVGLSMRTQRSKRGDFTKYQVGDVLEGKVDSVVPYGVFVDVGANVNALLHISRITGGAVENVRHHLNEGDPVSVHVIDLDEKKKTIAVSMLDKKADQYLDRRMSQRLKRFYGTAGAGGPVKVAKKDVKEASNDLDYFDQAIRELEDALKDRDE